MADVYAALILENELGQSIVADTVIEREPGPIRTKLLNQHGIPIYRIQETVPMGFHLPHRNPR